MIERIDKGDGVRRRRGILVIDDDRLLCQLIRTTFELEGFVVEEAHHVIEAERILVRSRPDAIILDIGLPGIDGLFYCERLCASPYARSIPIIVISGSDEAGRRAADAGAAAFMRKPFNPLELLALVTRHSSLVRRAGGVAEIEQPPIDAGDLHRLIEIGQHQHELLDQAYRQTVTALASALESRDFGTSAHSHRVTAFATRLTLDVEPSLLDDPSLEWGFLLHDVGKIGIPDSILLKRGTLTGPQRLRMQEHAVIGERLLSHIPLFAGEGIRIIRSHHERWDGEGYPDQLRGRQIPLGARIFAAVDALDAMTDTRPYKEATDWDTAMNEIARCSGSHFDPDVVEAVALCEPDLHRIHKQKIAA